MDEKYIIPTKESPVFIAFNDWFGYLQIDYYKNYLVNNCVGYTFAITFTDAVNRLHSWIEENPESVKDYSKSKFGIEIIDGELDKYGDPVKTKVYEISAKKAIKYILR